VSDLARLQQALVAADAAGDAQGAALLAAEIRRVQALGPTIAKADAARGAGGPSVMDTPPSAREEFARLPGWQRALVGAGAEFTDWGQAGKEMALRPLNAAGLVSDQTISDLDAARRDKQALDAPVNADFGGQVGRATAVLGATLGVPAQTVRGAAALGTALGALSPTDSEWQRVVQMLISGALGAAGQALGNKLIAGAKGGKSVQVSQDELSILRAMESDGYKLRPAQISGSKSALALETQLAAHPATAGAMADSQQGQRNLLAKQMFATFGERAPDADRVPAGTVQQVKNNFDAKYRAATNGVQLTQDEPFMDRALAAFSRPLTPAERRQVSFYINNIPPEFDGAFYQSWRARIGTAAESAQPELKGALKEVQAALDDAFDRQAPAGARRAMESVRGDYRNWATVRDLVAGAEAKGEPISALNIANSVKAQKALNTDAAEVGRYGRVVGRAGPNSGTAQNQFWRDVLTNPMGAATTGGVGGGALGAGLSLLTGDDPTTGAATGAGIGAPLGLAAMFGVPRAAGAAYLSDWARKRAMGAATKEVTRALTPQSAMAQVLRKLATDNQPLLERLVRSGVLASPELLLPAGE